MNKKIVLSMLAMALISCQPKPAEQATEQIGAGKPVVYQVFTRLFGNTNTTNKPWGTIAEIKD